MKFKDLAFGEAFTFESERTMPNSGMAYGPWVKTGHRSYKAQDERKALRECRVGSVAVEVDFVVTRTARKLGELGRLTSNADTSREDVQAYLADHETEELAWALICGLREVDTMTQTGVWMGSGVTLTPQERNGMVLALDWVRSVLNLHREE